MTADQLKQLFASVIKVVVGGPTTKTRGTGLRNALGQFVDWVKELADRGPNDRPDLAKSVRHLTRTNNPQFDLASDHALDELDTELGCLGTRCYVDFETSDYVLVYDDRPRPGGPASGPQCWRDGKMKAPTPMVPCQWVRAEDVRVNVPLYDAQFNANGNPPGYPIGYEVRYTPAGGTEGHYAADVAGQLAAPGATAGQWHQVAPPVPATVLYQVLPHAAARSADSDDQLTRGRAQLITERPGGGPAVRGTFSAFNPAKMQYATLEGQPGAYTYDLASDTATPTVAYDDAPLTTRVQTLETDLDAAENELTAVGNEVAGLEATQQQHTTQIAQNSGWIGTLGNLLTTAKTNLVAAINELFTALSGKADLVAGKVPVAQLPAPTATTGGITRAGRGLYGLTALNATAVDFVSEFVGTYDGVNGAAGLPGFAYALDGYTEFYMENSSAAAIGRLISVRNTGATALPVLGRGSAFRDTVQPGEMVWYKALDVASNFAAVLRAPFRSGTSAPDQLPYAAALALDFAANPVRTLALAGNVAFTTTGRVNGGEKVLRLLGDGTARTLAFPSAWAWLGSAPPTGLAAGKTAILSLTCFGPSESDVVAAYSAQP